MVKYNIYRINKDLEDQLIRKLTSESVGLKKISEKEVNSFKLQFFFSIKPDEVDIWWVNVYHDFFSDNDKPKNYIYFGILLISNNAQCYAISLGKSHFYLKQFCDSDFGLNLAQRIADENDFRTKNSKFYKSIKSKAITTYQKGNRVGYDSGESIHYLKAKTINPKIWGKVATFGNSVQLTLPIMPMDLPFLIKQIEKELLKPTLFDIPRVDEIRDNDKIKELDHKLVKAIMASSNISNVNIDEFSISGVDFIFSDRVNHSLYLKGSYDKEDIGELSIEKLINFVRHRNINLENDLNNVLVYVQNEHSRGHSEPVKYFLDFIDEDEKHCLIDGKWYKFNQSYLQYLEKEVNTIKLDAYDPYFDIPKRFEEDYFNKERAEKDGYINLDKSIEYLNNKSWERADLYKDETFYFVKIGTPQKLGYVTDQASATVKILQEHEKNAYSHVVKNICLWVILKRQNRISKLSDINSIIFLMKLINWKKIVEDALYTPIIRVNYVI